MAMAQTARDTIHDREFGTVQVRRMKQAKYVRLRIKTDGAVSITLPFRAAMRHAHNLLERSRPSIRKARQVQTANSRRWQDGDMIGMVYTLRVIPDEGVTSIDTTAQRTQAIVRHHPLVEAGALQLAIVAFVAKLLRKQAMAYLPRRLRALASLHGFAIGRIRFSSAQTRWGSCSSRGTISLNIWLMTLPHELIDYVLIHELCHTKHMNHSRAFWELVESCLPEYRSLRHEIKRHFL